jgi:hypothetical protein
MSQQLTEEVLKLAIVIAKNLQKNPEQATPEMLMTLRGCAEILEIRNQTISNKI